MASKYEAMLKAHLKQKRIQAQARKLGIASAPGRAGKAGYIVRTK